MIFHFDKNFHESNLLRFEILLVFFQFNFSVLDVYFSDTCKSGELWLEAFDKASLFVGVIIMHVHAHMFQDRSLFRISNHHRRVESAWQLEAICLAALSMTRVQYIADRQYFSQYHMDVLIAADEFERLNQLV